MLCQIRGVRQEIHTLEDLLEKAERNPLLLFESDGIKRWLKALGKDSKRDLNIPKVRIWFNGTNNIASMPTVIYFVPL